MKEKNEHQHLITMGYTETDINILLISVWIIFILNGIAILKFINKVDKHQELTNLSVSKLKLEHEKGLVEAKLKMQEYTLQQIAIDLHDNINLSFILAKANLEVLSATADPIHREKISDSIRLMQEGIKKTKALSGSLNTEWIKGLGLVSALEKEIDNLGKTGLFTIETAISGNQVIMDTEKELLIFRIVQESFNNIIKHSGAKKILFALHYHPDHADLSITDNGKGFDYAAADRKTGTGLTNIELRAKVLLASLTIHTAPGSGTAIRLSIPYDSAFKPSKKIFNNP
jgi:two-component system, NarL family, sensor kinase